MENLISEIRQQVSCHLLIKKMFFKSLKINIKEILYIRNRKGLQTSVLKPNQQYFFIMANLDTSWFEPIAKVIKINIDYIMIEPVLEDLSLLFEIEDPNRAVLKITFGYLRPLCRTGFSLSEKWLGPKLGYLRNGSCCSGCSLLFGCKLD